MLLLLATKPKSSPCEEPEKHTFVLRGSRYTGASRRAVGISAATQGLTTDKSTMKSRSWWPFLFDTRRCSTARSSYLE